MDYGKLTDHMGKSIDFTNVVLIMTSNIGANELVREKIGFLMIFLRTIMKKQLVVSFHQNLEID